MTFNYKEAKLEILRAFWPTFMLLALSICFRDFREVAYWLPVALAWFLVLLQAGFCGGLLK